MFSITAFITAFRHPIINKSFLIKLRGRGQVEYLYRRYLRGRFIRRVVIITLFYIRFRPVCYRKIFLDWYLLPY
ncbi:hypothetical protein FOXB_04603 [Fusarium oxysporum f. sp. conglutinans Fo5176]|uniref:Uncharacterized protein n=1 Tax=Fusarium oxysporum (strain Fo5176) TaxID=660025 RepID=F9FDX5_FUSOF|nr:hypothetical protein FOXB_04603 [Fusarium oxysporum f. sp. conglutinans Fo5176]